MHKEMLGEEGTVGVRTTRDTASFVVLEVLSMECVDGGGTAQVKRASESIGKSGDV